MSTALVSLDIARELLSDTIASIWTNPVLIPLLNQAYRELQTKLKNADCPIQLTESVTSVAAGTLVLNLTNIIEPVRLYEKPDPSTDVNYTRMTEKITLPFLAQGPKLNCWNWDGTKINFLGSTAATIVKARFFSYNVPITATGDTIPFINAENYLGPRLASLANQTIGENDQCTYYQGLADASLSEVIMSNRGISTSSKVRP